MKKVYLLLSLLIFLFCSVIQATTIDIDVADFAFTPADVVAQVGDTLVWTESGGTHTTTATTAPSGATKWDYTFTGAGDTYTYVLTVPGDYSYQCSNHPLTMMGTIRVADTLPFEENFDYTATDTLVNESQWQNHSGSGTLIVINSGGLSYSGYPSSGIGNSITINGGSGSREDINRNFTVQTSDVYAALLVNVASASTTADYFFHLAEAFPTFNYRGRVFVQDDGSGNLKFGVSKASSSTVSIAPGNYTYGTTYLLVLKYEVVGGGDDVVKLFINPVLTDPEPTADATNTDTGSDISVGGVAFRQGGNSYSVQVDGLRISTAWSDVVPVELTSFAANVSNNNVTLNWSTATELNNSGFAVERKQGAGNWSKIAFVDGHGTSTSPNKYSFTDEDLSAGNYSYRLKQVDFDGSYEYSNVVEANIGLPSKFELSQNYPNPFNPNTVIAFSLPQTGHVALRIYNVLGQEVSTLINGIVEAGAHNVEFNASNLSSGIYYYRLETNGLTSMKKMMLLK